MKSLEEVRIGGATLTMHLNGGHWYGYNYKCVADPRITIQVRGPKNRKSKVVRSTTYFVEGNDEEFRTLMAAYEALVQIDTTGGGAGGREQTALPAAPENERSSESDSTLKQPSRDGPAGSCGPAGPTGSAT